MADHDHPANDAAPPDSPLGRLDRALGSDGPFLRHPARTLDALQACDELIRYLEERRLHLVVGARMNKSTWADIGTTLGTSRQGAHNRFGSHIKELERQGLLEPVEGAAPAAPPAFALTRNDARSWCRTCGGRIWMAGTGWYHAASANDEKGAPAPGPFDHEPWPYWED